MRRMEALEQLGQSVWLDTIDRDLLTSGGLRKLIADDGVRGVTTNPTIFEQAITHGTAYDADIAGLALVRPDTAAIFESLEVADVTEAADQLRAVHDASGGTDGFVSIEVAPTRAFDTNGTVAEARRLWARVDRPNVMVKVPGTVEGLPAIEQLIAEGVNVNITLLFSVEMYRRVIEAYCAGLERRVKAGEPIERLRSVASFFVSRVDNETDKRLAERAAAAKDPAERRRIEGLLGRAAVANAQLAYEAFQASVASPRFQALKARGASVQRPLWASTSTKNPKYPDTMYVDRLIGPDTVNTMPLATLRAFADHGTPARTIDQKLDEARAVLADIERCGVSIRQVTDLLVVDGVKKFSDSYHALLAALEVKRDQLIAKGPVRASRRLAVFGDDVASLVKREGADKVRRLFARDPALWVSDAPAQQEVAERLGWLDLPRSMAAGVADLTAFVEGVRRAGYTRMVLLGMGGSSLAPETFGRVFGAKAGYPALAVLDSTDPAFIAAVEKAAPLEHTLFLVSSKSGTTLETSDLFAYFWERTGGRAEQFVAITDPGTPLAAQARERKLRRLFENPPDIGGRYSALSLFGLVPAAGLGIDVAALLARAARMADACAAAGGGRENPGLALGAALAAGWHAGRDKVTIVTGPGLEAFGPWAEQLLAESTGQEGQGPGPGGGGAARPALGLRQRPPVRGAADGRGGGAGARGGARRPRAGGPSGGAPDARRPARPRRGVLSLGSGDGAGRLVAGHQRVRPAQRGREQGEHGPRAAAADRRGSAERPGGGRCRADRRGALALGGGDRERRLRGAAGLSPAVGGARRAAHRRPHGPARRARRGDDGGLRAALPAFDRSAAQGRAAVRSVPGPGECEWSGAQGAGQEVRVRHARARAGAG